jgi:hypothetical protein
VDTLADPCSIVLVSHRAGQFGELFDLIKAKPTWAAAARVAAALTSPGTVACASLARIAGLGSTAITRVARVR